MTPDTSSSVPPGDSPLELHLVPGTDLRVGPNTLRYLRAQQARAAGEPVTLLATHARTGLPLRTTVPPSRLPPAPPPSV